MILRVFMQILTLMEEGAEDRRIDGIFKVGVIEDDHGIVTAEFENRALERAACSLSEKPRGRHTADEIHAAHCVAPNTSSAKCPASPGAWVTTLRTPGGKPASLGDFRHDESCGYRGQLGGLDHDGVPGG
jgi:hypothetical protein